MKLSKRQNSAEEEKKDSFDYYLDPMKATSSTSTFPPQDTFVSALDDKTTPAVADLWKEVTWYPVVDTHSEHHHKSTEGEGNSPTNHATSSSSKRPPPYRRWMAVQGAVYTPEGWMREQQQQQQDDEHNHHVNDFEQSRPLYRHASSWSHGEPYRAESWTPLVAQIRDALQECMPRPVTWNHVSIECWQWNESSNKKASSSKHRHHKSVTVAHERIDPTLDLEPCSPAAVRVFLTGPLCENNEDDEQEQEEANIPTTITTENNNSNTSNKLLEEEEDDDKTEPMGNQSPKKDGPADGAQKKLTTTPKQPEIPPERLGTVYLRPKRFDHNNKRRESPRPRQSLRITDKTIWALGWSTNSSMTYEISIKPPPTASASSRITMMLTFRQVATWLVETQGRLPRIVSRLRPSPAALQSEEDRAAEYARLTAAFYEEKRQEGLSTERVYGTGSLLIPTTKTKPCLAKSANSSTTNHSHANRELQDDALSVATPTSVTSVGGMPASVVSSPIHNIHMVDASDRFDDDDDDEGFHFIGGPDDDHHEVHGHHHDEDDDEENPETAALRAHDRMLFTPHEMGGNAVALLVVDLQNDFLGDDPNFLFSKMTSNGVSPLAGPRRSRLLRRIDELAKEVRDQKGVVVFCRSVYGRWSQSTATKAKLRTANSSSSDSMAGAEAESVSSSRSASVKAGTHLNRTSCCSVGTAGSDFYPDAVKMIQEQDVVMTKQWYSAFLETSLHAQLQRLGVQTVVVCGVTTNHSVSATVRSAAHLGYQVIVSSDGTAQLDPSLQPETEAKLQAYGAILAPQMSLKEILSPEPVTPRSLHRSGPDRLDFDGWNRLSAVGSGDSFLLPDFFDPDDADRMLDKLKPSRDGEVTWKLHTEQGGRAPLFTAYQCSRNENGHAPIFRMANLDDHMAVTDWTASVRQARVAVEEHSGHSYNWVRLLHHASPKDSVRFRSDMCLDMREDAHVAIAALGEGLVLELRPKPGVPSSTATAQKIYLRHNSVFLLGPETNRLFQYSLRCSRRAAKHKVRISLTFRELVTFQVDRANKEKIFYGPGTHYPTWKDVCEYYRKHRMWEGAGLIACGASSLTLLHGGSTGNGSNNNKLTDQLALAAAPVLGLLAVYQYMNYRRRSKSRKDEARLEQAFIRCNWQALKYDEARRLFLHASDEELFGKKSNV